MLTLELIGTLFISISVTDPKINFNSQNLPEVFRDENRNLLATSLNQHHQQPQLQLKWQAPKVFILQ